MGYDILGPTVKNGAIVLGQIRKEDDLPIGWMDEQAPGRYELKRRQDNALFGYNLGPHSWKKYLFPSEEKLYTIQKQNGALSLLQEAPRQEKKAFLAVRACEIEAIKIQDKVFIDQPHQYKGYSERRENLLIIAVNCTRHVSTCFCTAMRCGPKVTYGYDIALTELLEDGSHTFLIDVLTEKGRKLISVLPTTKADAKTCTKALGLIEKNAATMKKEIDTEAVRDMLKKSWFYKQWDDVALRCVSCGNCTSACPTCFCSKREEVVSLSDDRVDTMQRWESCFNLSHSYVHGGSVRYSLKSKYRQWLTHKFSTWWDQFGLSGCVGCGRCITWCPVGIDVRKELVALQKEDDENNS